MAISNINEILNELGWGDGFRIPVANEENKRLEEEIERKVKLKASLNAKLKSLDERVKMIKRHDNNIATQHDLNQKLLADHSAQLEVEEHHYRLSVSTESNLRQEARDFKKEWNDVNRRISNIEQDLTKITKRLETSKKTIKLDENSLSKWEEMLNREEEGNQFIEACMKQDAKKYKELEQKRQKLSTELESYRNAVMKSVNATHEMEIVLHRTAKLYGEALKERQKMINQWTQSVTILRQRDDDIQKVLKEIEMLHEIEREKTTALQEAEQFLKSQIVNNKQLEDSIKQLEKRLLTMKNEHRKITDAIGTYAIEVYSQRKNMEDLARRTKQVRGSIKRKKTYMENKSAKIEDYRKRIDELSSVFDNVDNKKLSVEDKTRQLEKMIEDEEKRKVMIIKEINRLQAAILRTGNQISEFENERKVLEMQNQNEHKNHELLNTTCEKEKKFLEERKEALYEIEFNVQNAEIKLQRNRGKERDKTEAEKKLKRIEELQNALTEKTKVSKLLQNQIKSLEQDMKKISNSLICDNTELERLRNNKGDLVLLMDGGEKQLKVARCHNENLQVEENILRLKVSQVEQIMNNIGDKVYNLEKYRLQLEAALREREAEIEVQKESLVVQKRIAANECSELRNAITERKNRVRQLQIRYENCISTFGHNADGTPITTTYLKIQSAQEKYLLQEQGDKLDETIRKTEQEIQSMENTLRIINACNDKYKMNLSNSDQHELEEAEQKKNDEVFQEAQEMLKQKQMSLQHLIEDCQNVDGDYDKLLKNVNEAKEEKENKEQYLTSLEQQLTDQREKMERAGKSLRRVQKDIQDKYASTGDDIILIQQKEVALRELQEQNAMALQDIAEFTIRHIEAEAYVKKLLAAKNIELPCIPQSSQCISGEGSTECPLKSTSRTSVITSSRESIGSIVNIEPHFDTTMPISTVSGKNIKYNKPFAKSTTIQQSSTISKKYHS